MKNDVNNTVRRYPILVGVKTSRELANIIKHKARLNGRTVSGYLRWLLTKVLLTDDGAARD